MRRRFWFALSSAVVLLAASPGMAALRDDIAQTAFATTDKAQAIAQIGSEIATANALLAADPSDREAMLQRGVAIGYRAKLTKNRTDALAARQIFEALARGNPRDPEVQLALATWHLDSVDQLGGLIAGAAIGAKKADGEAALDRAVALGRNRAFVLGAAALLRIRLNDADVVRARQLVEASANAPAPSAIDRLMKRNAGLVLVPLRAGDGKAAKALARTLLPFGKLL